MPGPTALVTGAASGIGAATARLLAQEGAYVYCSDLDRQGAESVAAGIGAERAAPLSLDVADEAGWAAAMRAIVEAGRQLSVLVHAAGIAAAGSIRDTSLAEWRRVMAINLDGAFLATRHGIEAMHQHGGSVVLVGSASGIRPAAGAVAYSTSKAGLAMLARTAAKECRDAGIPVRINVVSPGGVKTPLWRAMPFFQDLITRHGSEEAAFAAVAGSGPPFGTAESVAEVIAFLASPKAAQITGAELPVDAGYVL